MAKFVPKDKLGKKALKELNRLRRVTWDFSPVTKTVDSKKIYSRKRKARNRDDYGPGFLLPVSIQGISFPIACSTAAQNSGITRRMRTNFPSRSRNTCSEVPLKTVSFSTRIS